MIEDMSELERLANAAPHLKAGLDGKLHRAPPPDKTNEEFQKAAWALAKAVADAEGKWLHRKLKRLMPRKEYDRACTLAKGGQTFTMRKLMNEWDVKIIGVQGNAEQQQADFEAGIQRRHLQVWRGPRLVAERVWEWRRFG
jgi:hypothetical protein